MSQCEHTQHHTGGVKICFLCAAEAAAARTRMQQHLENLESNLAVGMNVVLKTDEQQGSFQLGRVVKEPYTTLVRKECDGEYAGAGSRLVDVEVYAEEKVSRRRGTGRARATARAVETDYLSRKPAGSCDKLYCKCGPAVGCLKQHVTTFRLKQVREPIGFRLIAPRARRVQSAEPLRYQLDDLTRQRIAASLDAV